eukprot:2779683-Rhodomonas_salina.3
MHGCVALCGEQGGERVGGGAGGGGGGVWRACARGPPRPPSPHPRQRLHPTRPPAPPDPLLLPAVLTVHFARACGDFGACTRMRCRVWAGVDFVGRSR